jgi:nifR3 family TIM-barrel protein
MSVLRYGPIEIDPPVVLAPMAGITDRQFRLILRRIGGVGLVTMEFISSEALVRRNKRTRLLMRFAEEERPISIQIYGRDPAHMAEAARAVEAVGADICDINMGCPANKILKGCSGCALMGDLDLATAIVRAVRRELSIPLSVKFRLGLNDERRNYLELGRICQGEGVDLVAMHARTARQMFGGRADWSEIARLKETLSIPVVGNGDIAHASDAIRMLAETGCDGVMIGRASMKNPWIYRQIADLLAGRLPYEPTIEDRHDVIRAHFDMVTAQEEPEFALHKLRTFTGWYTHGLVDGKRLRTQISIPETPQAFLEVVERFFADATKAAA